MIQNHPNHQECTVLHNDIIKNNSYIQWPVCQLFSHVHLFTFLATETISISPSFGAVHTGGFVVISGPPTALYRQARTAIIVFGDDEELNCFFTPALPTPICPVPLFHPESAGLLNVTFTVNYRTGVCTFNGHYRVGKSKHCQLCSSFHKNSLDTFTLHTFDSRPIHFLQILLDLSWKVH